MELEPVRYTHQFSLEPVEVRVEWQAKDVDIFKDKKTVRHRAKVVNEGIHKEPEVHENVMNADWTSISS